MKLKKRIKKALRQAITEVDDFWTGLDLYIEITNEVLKEKYSCSVPETFTKNGVIKKISEMFEEEGSYLEGIEKD